MNSPKGYILDRYPVNKEVPKYIKELINSIPNINSEPWLRHDCYRFFAQIVGSTFIRGQNKKKYRCWDSIPMYSKLLERNFHRGFKPAKLFKHYMEWLPHSINNKKSREYKLNSDILINITDLYDGNSDCKYNLMTYTSSKLKPLNNLVSYHEGTKRFNQPKLIIKSINNISEGLINTKQINKYADKIRKKLKNNPKSKKLSFIIINYNIAMSTFRVQGLKHVKGDLYNYTPVHEVLKTGRLIERGGGFQNANRYFKYLLLMDTGYVNYDLKSSQAYVLQQFFDKFEIECEWLDNYLESKDIKTKIAKKLGITVELWKKFLYSIFFGSTLGTNNRLYYINGEEFEIHRASVCELLKKDYPNTYKKIYEKIYKELRELLSASKKLRSKLLVSKDKTISYKSNGARYWKNASCKFLKEFCMVDGELYNTETMKLATKNESSKFKKQLAAFILQGTESSFIHNLTNLCSDNNIKVFHNEHDGLVMEKPDEKVFKRLIRKASLLSGFRNPILVEKPLCSKKEIKKYEDLLN